jgi:hypothetical protein
MVGARKLALLPALLLVGLAPHSVLAATAYTENVEGVEIAATATQGQFVGVAGGQLTGLWRIVVDHQPLSGTTPAAITGGSLDLATVLNGSPVTVTAGFATGSVTQSSGFIGCTNQQYAVSGSLNSVGVQGAGTGTGTFNVILTHYQARIFGRCITYSASVAGTVTLSF